MTDAQAKLDALMHRGVRGLRRVHTQASHDAMARLKQALAQGANPNHRHADGRTPLEFLATDKRAQGRGKHGIDQFAAAACMLIRHGADPLLPSCRLLTQGNSYISVASAGAAVQYERDTGKRWHDGQTPLHELGMEPQGWGRLAYFASLGVGFPDHWARLARDSDGASPLHLAWRPGVMVPGYEAARKAFTQRLLQMGARLDDATHEGVRVWELISQEVERGGAPADEATMQQVLAMAELEQLEQGTAPAGVSGPRRRRRL